MSRKPSQLTQKNCMSSLQNQSFYYQGKEMRGSYSSKITVYCIYQIIHSSDVEIKKSHTLRLSIVAVLYIQGCGNTSMLLYATIVNACSWIMKLANVIEKKQNSYTLCIYLDQKYAVITKIASVCRGPSLFQNRVLAVNIPLPAC